MNVHIFPQWGHSKSANSTTVTGASAGPREAAPPFRFPRLVTGRTGRSTLMLRPARQQGLSSSSFERRRLYGETAETSEILERAASHSRRST